MAYEVDFLGVGENSQSGDAIALRFGNLLSGRSEQTVVVIDGGFTDTGDQIVEHIREHYGTNIVDLVISTHPDQDHINGLETVLRELDVRDLWIHQPWRYNELLQHEFADGRITSASIAARLRQNLQKAYDLVRLAEQRGVNVFEPYVGTTFGYQIRVVGPSQQYYLSLVPDFEGMPRRADDGGRMQTFAEFVRSAGRLVQRLAAGWGRDELDEEDTTSAKNNSSVITEIIADGRKLLFTGDAGVTALQLTEPYLQASADVPLSLFQVPHHGSKRNLSPTVLNNLIGRSVVEGETRDVSAIISCAKHGNPKHPSAKVINALIHRGASVTPTYGRTICHKHGVEFRPGWSAVDGESYKWTYEETE